MTTFIPLKMVLSRTKLEKLSAFGKPPARPGFAADKEPNGWPQADTLEGEHLDELGTIPPR
jgi:hypothetical protein